MVSIKLYLAVTLHENELYSKIGHKLLATNFTI